MKTLVNYSKYLFTKRTTTENYMQMRRDYVLKRNQDAEMCSFINSIVRPKYNINKSIGILGELNTEKVDKIVLSLKENGIFIFDKRISEVVIESIKGFMETAPVFYCSSEKGMVYKPSERGYRNSMNLSNRFDLRDLERCNTNSHLLGLIVDQNFLHIANAYLNAKPILDSVSLWWNKTIPAELSQEQKDNLKSASAQMFHLDMDRLNFLKFFVYLTDVTEETGPHVYVRNTHRKSPAYLEFDGRYSDIEIEKNAKENILTVCGSKGTVLAVDTRGLHKGKVLTKGERLIFEVEFTNSLFGNPSVPEFDLNLNPETKYKEVYRLFLSNGIK